MKTNKFQFNGILVVLLSIVLCYNLMPDGQSSITKKAGGNSMIKLSKPRYTSKVSLETTIKDRRSKRSYSIDPITLAEISQLLWATQGITCPKGLRAAPSAGALYPLEVFIVVGNAQGLESGIYKYFPRNHELKKFVDGDKRQELYKHALEQDFVKNSAATIVICAVYSRVTRKYGDRGKRYVHIEVGHASQNAFLQATALGLFSVVVGAFDDEDVQKLIGAATIEQPLYLMPVGKPS